MRNYYFFTVLVGLLFMGCTVDNDELNFNEDQIQTANLEINDVCMPSIYGIENSGELLGNVTVSNSNAGNIAYVKFTAEPGFYITEIRLMQADDENGLPINNGGVIPGKLEKLTYPSVSEVDFEYEVSSYFVLAARVTFVDQDGKKYTSWIGNEKPGSNNSTYLSYNVCIPPQQEPVCDVYAGENNRTTIDLEFLRTQLLNEWQVRDLYKSLIDPEATPGGVFNPTISELIEQVNIQANSGGSILQEWPIEYIVTGTDCTDSATLIVELVETL